MVLVERFDPDAVLDRIELHGCTWMLGLPFMYDALLERQRKQPRKVSSLRHCKCGGDVFPIQLQVDFEATFGAPLRNIWAATEVVGALRVLAYSLGLSLGLRRARRFVSWTMKAGMCREARSVSSLFVVPT